MRLSDRKPGAPSAQTTRTLAAHLRQRLRLGFLIILVIAAGALITGALATLATDRAYSAAVTQTTATQGLVGDLNEAIVSEVLHTRAFLLTGDEQSLTNRELSNQDFERAYAALLDRLGDLPETAAFTLQRLMTLHAEYAALAEEMIALRRSGETEAATKLFDERSEPIVLKLLAASRDLQSDIRALVFAANRSYSTRTERIILLAVFMFLYGALLSSWIVTRLFAPPLSALDYLEQALIETAQSRAISPAQLPRSLPEQRSPVFQAYNALVARLWESEASWLDFLGKIAHNLRSPLASIVGYAELLSNPALRPAEANLEGYARIILQQAARLGLMVEQMVMAAQIDKNQLVLTLAPVRVSALLSKAVAEARGQSRREIAFEDEAGSTIIACDALHLRQAFWNLLDNALKFSPPDRPVQVSVRRVSAWDWVEITVADHGLGIAEADRPILFTRFGRIEDDRARGAAGNGLGLYVVKHIVERHGGRIAVHSQPGQGARFVVTLPVGNEAASTGRGQRG